MLETWTVQDREQRSGMLIGAADIMARLSQEVGDGKYATAQEFISELQRCFGGS